MPTSKINLFMYWQLNSYVLLLFISALVAGAVAAYAWRRRPATGATALTVLMLGAAEWSFAYALEIGFTNLPAKIFWAKLEYIGITIVPLAMLFIALQHTGQEKWLTRRNFTLLSIIPVAAMLLAWTNETHGLIWARVELATANSFSLLDLEHGTFFWVYVAYDYLLLLLSAFLLLRAFLFSVSLQRLQSAMLLLGALFPWGGNFLYLTELNPFPNLDLTPISYSFSGLALAWGLFRYRLLDVVPIARAKVVESMNDAVIVLDTHSRIVDINPTALRLVSRPLEEIIGQPLKNTLPINLSRNGLGKPHRQIMLGDGEAKRHYDLFIAPVYARRGRLTGRLLILHDITERVHTETALRESQQKLSAQNVELRKLSQAVAQSANTVIITDLNGIIEYANPKFVETTGYSLTEALGKNPRILKSGEHSKEFYQELWETIKAGREWRGEFHNRRKDGTLYWEQATISPIYDSAGHMTNFIAIKENITARKEAAKALQWAKEATDTRAAQLATLNRVALIASSILNFQEMLDYIAQELVELFDVDTCGIALLNPERTALSVVAEHTRTDTPSAVGMTIPLKDNPLLVRVIETRKPGVLSNPEMNLVVEHLAAVIDNRRIQHIMILPLTARGQVIGTIGLDASDLNRKFIIADMRLGETVAGQVAGAIENARLFEEAQRRADEMTALVEMGREITATLELSTVLERIAARAKDLLNAKDIGVYLRQSDDVHFRCVVALGEHTAQTKAFLITLGQGIAGNVAATGIAELVNEPKLDPRVLTVPGTSDTDKKGDPLMCAPLIARDEVIGFITLWRVAEVGYFTPADLNFLIGIARQAAIAIENARLFDEAQRRAEEAETLQQAGAAVAASLDQDEAIKRILQELARVIPYDSASVQLLRDDYLEIVGGRGWPDPDAVLGSRLPVPGDNPNTVVVQERLVYNLPNAPEKYSSFREPAHELIQSWLGVPLIVRDRVIGILAVDSYRSNYFTADHARQVAAFADQVALAVQNAKLFSAEQHQRRIAESLREVATIINQSLDRDTVLSKILEQIGKVVQYDGASIFLQEGDELILSRGGALTEKYVGHRVSLESADPAIRVFKYKRPLVIIDLQYDLGWKRRQEETPAHSWVGAPLLAGERVIGVLAVDSTEIGAYDELDAQNLQIFANQAAIAIENARLFAAARQAQREAEAANRAKSTFLANMSHELRTPLNAILGFAQIMLNEPNVTDETRENLEIIIRSGDHLLTMINQVLDLSKIEAGRLTYNERAFDLHQLLDDLDNLLRLRAADKQLQLVFMRDADVPQYVRTDEVKLRQVLINLLNNALKFTAEGGVVVRVRAKDRAPLKKLIFEVEDTGPGIAPDELDDIFETFVQTRSGQAAQEGTGLGLPISRKFVEAMGGQITVQSELGRGTTFQFSIEVSLASVSEVRSGPTARRVVALEPDQPRYRILIVDDQRSNRQLLIKMLNPFGFELREASNGQEAVTVWQGWNPHLIWMDIRMPIMDGYEATERIRAACEDDPARLVPVIIALTASAPDEDMDRFRTAGYNDFLRKPFRSAEVFELMSKHLGVRYVYQDTTEAVTVGREEVDMTREGLTAEMLTALTLEMLRDLEQATVRSQFSQIMSIVDQIRDHDERIAIALEKLVDNFEYDKIIELMRAAAAHRAFSKSGNLPQVHTK